mmetsp:Transcript_19545/g.35384  ORF Transcript_19545/g.35384 Transcript_19545/m.35384 type:complete len:209 (+) Transcript_19545:202-828(+)
MPRFFDDYSNTYLTHDSAAGRKQQRRGWKFRENFKLHYQKNLGDWRAGPMGLASAQQAYLRTSRNPAGQINPDDRNVPPLPEGWKEEKDDATGVYYYTNDENGERSWVRPDFRPPPSGGGMMGGPPPNFRGRPPPQMGGPPPFQQGPPPQMGGPPPFQRPPQMGAPPQFQQPPPPHHFAPPPRHPGAPGMPPPNFPPPPPSSFPRPPS